MNGELKCLRIHEMAMSVSISTTQSLLEHFNGNFHHRLKRCKECFIHGIFIDKLIAFTATSCND